MNRAVILFEDFERAVMLKMLEERTEVNDILRHQYERASVLNREFTGVGFFTDFHLSTDLQPISSGEKSYRGDVVASINGSPFQYGFVLFTQDGYLDFLEGYTWGDSWPETIETYKLIHSDELTDGTGSCHREPLRR